MADSDWKECLPFAGKWHTTPGGHRMHYVDEGAAHVPVVVVGGIVGWTYHFRNLIAALQEYGFRVIAVDNLGCGLSDKPKEYGYSLEGHIQNLSSLLDGTLKIPPFHLVAQGYGIATALGYASRNPGLVRKIVLLNAISPIDAPPAGALSCFVKSLLWEKSCLAVRRMPVRGTLFPLDPIVRRTISSPCIKESPPRCHLLPGRDSRGIRAIRQEACRHADDMHPGQEGQAPQQEEIRRIHETAPAKFLDPDIP